MPISKIILRYMFGIVIFMEAAFFLAQLCEVDSVDILRFMYLYVTFFIHVPAIICLIVLSILTSFTKKTFWSFFKIEYYFLFISLTPFVIGWSMYLILSYLK